MVDGSRHGCPRGRAGPAARAAVLRAGALLALLGAAAVPALAQTRVKVTDAWVRATVAQQSASGAFMRLTADDPATLVEARSPVAASVQIHQMSMDGNVMRMRQVATVDLPAGRPVDLSPGGYHIMLIGLKAPLKAGDTVPLTLVVEGADRRRAEIDVRAAVRPLGAPAGSASPPAR